MSDTKMLPRDRNYNETTIWSTDYLSPSLEPDRRKTITDNIVKTLRRIRKKQQFSVIVVRGVSGLLYAGEVSRRLNVDLMVVRKGESCHGHHNLEIPSKYSSFVHRNFNFIILDDFISSGDTVCQILTMIEKYFPNAKFQGFASWTWNKFHSKDTLLNKHNDQFNWKVDRFYNDLDWTKF